MDALPVVVRRHLVVELVRNLNETGSWSGATHVQKCMFFLEHMLNVPAGYDFVIYYYGPFSFDLDRDLVLLQSRGWLTVKREAGYGVHYRPGPRAPRARPDVGDHAWRSLRSVAELFGGKGVKDLELMATTYYVYKGLDGRTRGEAEAVSVVRQLKPHLSEDAIRSAWRELQRIEQCLARG